MKHIDHAAEAIRLIDAALAEQDQAVAEIHTAAEQNGTEVDEAHLVYGWFHDAGLDNKG